MGRMLIFTVVLCLAAAIFIMIVIFLKSTLTILLSGFVSTGKVVLEIKIYFLRKEFFTFKMDEKKLAGLIESLPDFAVSAEIPGSGKGVTPFFRDWRPLCFKLVSSIKSLHLTEKIRMSHFVWKTSFGSGDAGDTAVLCGLIWSTKSIVMPLIGKMISDQPRIEVVPLFQEKRFTSQFSCMMSLKAGEAIRTMREIRRQLKEGERDGGSSDTRSHENGFGKPSVHDRRQNGHR